MPDRLAPTRMQSIATGTTLTANANRTISIVVPCHNEADSLKSFLQATNAALKSIPDASFELVFIDDGSTDATLPTLLTLAEVDSRIRVIELSRNFGKEAALTAGIDFATGDAIIPMDADLQDPPALIPALVEKWREGHEVVLAQRINRNNDSLLKRVTALGFYRLHNSLSDHGIPENVGDFRLMDRKVVDELKRFPERGRFMKGLFAWVGFRTVTVEYERAPRIADVSKFGFWRLWNFALEGITGFSTLPLRVWTYVGFTVSLCAFVYGIFMLIRTLLYGNDVPGYASLLVSVMFLGGLQLMGLGVIGEYVGRVHQEAKGRPIYIVRQTYSGDDDRNRVA